MRGPDAGSPSYALKRFKYNSHYWVLKFLSSTQRPLRILDVGTANGYLGAILRAQGHSLVGLEEDAAAAQQARRYYDCFHVVDVESFEFPYREEFDFILFADVLEHVRDPIRVLQRSLPTLKKTGELIISLPNVANIVIRLSLLAGRFDYYERGILDKTHLRFFTLSGIRKMIQQASCRVLEVAPTPLPVQLVVPISERGIFSPFHEAHYLLVKSWKTLFAYQFVVRAAPESIATNICGSHGSRR